ncbi:sugar ABC transporter substrate-binding protein [Streptacidiphilus sp. N1-3]|uniref:Sugar ABC transporter substrate-binding protein n=1 Tax=Streptacidiphilus alkalitolerans TaxID=3342712 RepID=A0ABV6X3P9_9ACTN
MNRKRLLATAACAAAGTLLLAACGSGGSTGTAAAGGGSGSAQIKIGVDLTFNNTAFWSAYVNYEQQYAKDMNIKLLGPLLAGSDASLQNNQIQTLVNEGAQAIVVNPETAASLGPAIAYATAHHVQLISVDTVVSSGHVYMVVRASNTLYGQDACAFIASKVTSGYVMDLEGDLTSSNGADRTNAFDACMAANAPGVTVLKKPTQWNDATAVTDAQNAINAYGSKLKAIYSQWSSPDTGIIPLLDKKGLGAGSPNHVLLVSDDGVPFEMCDIGKGTVDASQSQPADLYAKWALTYAVDAAKGVKLAAGQPGGGAPTLQNVTYQGDTNLSDPIVAPFVTKAEQPLTLSAAQPGFPSGLTSTAVSDSSLWGNVYGAAHGGVCNTTS